MKQTHYELFKDDLSNSDETRCVTNPDLDMEILKTSENDNERIKTSLNRKRTIFLFDDNKGKYKEDMQNLDKKMDNIQDSIKIDFQSQAKNFEEVKKNKLQKINSIKSKLNYLSKNISYRNKNILI